MLLWCFLSCSVIELFCACKRVGKLTKPKAQAKGTGSPQQKKTALDTMNKIINL